MARAQGRTGNKQTEFSHLAENLRFLCGHYSSISEVCRRLDINRQQFNRYLAGKTYPSYRNLKSICDFFGVDREEIMLDHDQFRRLLSSNNRTDEDDDSQTVPDKLYGILSPMLSRDNKALDAFEGFYFRYFYSFGFPGYIFRSFVRIYSEDGITYFRQVERSTGRDPAVGERMCMNYHGTAFMMRDRLVLIERELRMDSTFSETILTPNYRSNNPYLSGMMLCTSTCAAHQPGSARTVFEYLGKRINVREALRRCDLYHHTDPEIPEKVKRAITNELAPGEFTLRPVSL